MSEQSKKKFSVILYLIKKIITDSKTTEYSILENFKISGKDNMLNKISVIKCGELASLKKEKEYKTTQGISALVAIDDFFTWLHFISDGDKIIPPIQKK